ncbi:MAG: DUF5305 family protein [Nitrososphaeria archaeon]
MKLKFTLGRRNKLIFAAVFGVLSAIALAATLYYFSVPTEAEVTTSLWSYRSKVNYDVVAYLKSNNFYNKTTLRPEEGTLYSRIIDRLNIVFKYNFESNKPLSGSVDYFVTIKVKTPAWEKVLDTTLLKTIPLEDTSRSFEEQHVIIINDYWEVVRAFDKETGTNTNEFNITCQYFINVRAQSGLDKINEKVSPSIDLIVKPRSNEGDIIALGKRDYIYPGSVEKKETVQIVSIFGIYRYQYRYLGIVGFTVAFAFFTFLMWSYIKMIPKREKPITDLIRPYRELVAEAMEPIRRRGEIVITMNNLEDLVKVSDNLAKPILHTKNGKTHTFYIYDGPNRYEYNKDEQV